MQTIESYVSEKLHLKKGVERYNDDFTKDMQKLWELLKGEMGGREHHEIMADLGEFDDEYEHLTYVYKENVFGRLLYSIVNYDLISLYPGNKVNIQKSNHPDIAKIMKKYATPEMIQKTYKAIFY